MHIGIVCKVIDNFGDAGFSLRLAKALAKRSFKVSLFHDHALTFQALYPTAELDGLQLLDATSHDFQAGQFNDLTLLLEPFGTSSEHTAHRFDLALKDANPSAPCLLIDYLSSEAWVEDFHLSNSVNPATGRLSTYFYPGFTAGTGGLIHCDFPDELRQQGQSKPGAPLRVFVFSYANAPVTDLLKFCEDQVTAGHSIQVGIAGNHPGMAGVSCATAVDFCPQTQFDQLLAIYDVLFVRGEDSFVRAQLAGKPIIWQIYATLDNAHAAKLESFFALYAEGLSTECANALWRCWSSWNRIDERPEFAESWAAFLAHLPELRAHAIAWQGKLFAGPELVKEVLTWWGRQTPTLIEKPDL